MRYIRILKSIFDNNERTEFFKNFLEGIPELLSSLILEGIPILRTRKKFVKFGSAGGKMGKLVFRLG